MASAPSLLPLCEVPVLHSGDRAPTRRTVVAVVPHSLQASVQAALPTTVGLIRVDSLEQAEASVRADRTVEVLLVSPGSLADGDHSFVRRIHSISSGVLPIALLHDNGPAAAQRLLGLGASGVRYLVDVNQKDGWKRLRKIVADSTFTRTPTILTAFFAPLEECHVECRELFELLIRSAPRIWTAGMLAGMVRVRPSTLMSRFGRAGLPSPKSYLTMVRLAYAAALFDEGAGTVAEVAYRLGHASPQSFGRHLRIVMGITPSEFRSRYPFNAMLDRLVASHVQGYIPVLRQFAPITGNAEGT